MEKHYLRTDMEGIVLGITDDPIMAGLYDGHGERYTPIGKVEATVVEKMLRDPKFTESTGLPPLHIDDLVELVPSI